MEFGLVAIVFSIFNLSFLEGYRILLLPSSIESHQIYFSRFGDELIKHGHHVTFLIGNKKTIIPDVQVSLPFGDFNDSVSFSRYYKLLDPFCFINFIYV